MFFYRAIAYLPFPLLYAVAWLAYLILYYIAGYRKAVVYQNLQHAFPERNASEITVLAKKFYRQLSQTAFEIVKAQRMRPRDFRERVQLRNPELLLEKSLDQTRSVIVLTIHQGNWEWMLHGATTALGIPIDPVYKPLHNRTVDRLIYSIRSQFGSRPLAMDESTRDILRRRREFRIFVMVADQSPIRSERSYWTTFLNREAAFYQGSESLAQLTGFPVLFAQCRRQRRGHYEVIFHEVGEPPYDKGSHNVIDRYVELAEQAIREEPESWLWSNRRWKRDRRKEDAAAAEELAG
ncbi:lysophospholipid acyltransferase family protein [Parahaliea aestuarii]|uniref:Lysophospholipid acyltransferase family protein n=1 Tax=Parahaliea aestuarii TaxID=1852021 RepID=A0A5C8ZMK9_9GAMM|nr:lysophospholipid acyltransferase family protein [Parahaliea aestuarii]TXS89713.1 lysophospholipid acyltransferase family protein [Parahaliea aestuarii]